MQWWRKMLAILGVSSDARVNIRARGIDVTIIGDPAEVKAMLDAVKRHLETRHRKKALGARSGSLDPSERVLNTDSQVVRPSDLDEMDSPYAIPLGGANATRTDGVLPPGELTATPAEPRAAAEVDLRSTVPFDAELRGLDDLPEAENEVTAVAADPSVPAPVVSVTDLEVETGEFTPLAELLSPPAARTVSVAHPGGFDGSESSTHLDDGRRPRSRSGS